MPKPEPRSKASTKGATTGACAKPVDYGQLDERIGYHLRRAQIAVFADFYASFESVNIRPVQYSILTIIEANPGLLQTQVSDALGIRKTNFVGLIVGLEKRGLVKRVQQENDRRSYGLYLSETGKDFMPHLHQLAQQHEQGVIGALSDKQTRDLFALLKAIAAKPPRDH